VCVCVCVCVCVRARARACVCVCVGVRARETDRETGKEGDLCGMDNNAREGEEERKKGRQWERE
jgi:hypothetical protein